MAFAPVKSARQGSVSCCATPAATTLVVTTSPSLVWATTTWILSALAGYLAEQQRYWPDAGILVTLATSAAIGVASPPLLAWGWSTWLPASLAFLLLSLDENVTKDNVEDSNNSNNQSNNNLSPTGSISRLAVPFGLASLGSLLGCGLVFGLCCACGGASPWLLRPAEAQVALSCLAASFVGGTVNFLATAHVIAAAAATATTATSTATTSIVSSMAATDILVMAIYFALIGSAVSSERLASWFGTTSKPPKEKSPVRDSPAAITFMIPDSEQASNYKQDNIFGILRKLGAQRSLQATVLSSSFVWAIVRVANSLERKWAHVVPGLACAVIAAVTPALKRLLRGDNNSQPWTYQDLSSSSRRRRPNTQQNWYRDMQILSKPLSQISFLLLFASIGSTANWSQAVRSGPACLTVSLLALAVHFVVAFAGSVAWSRRRNRIELADVLVASNAAIGGPATAAAFAGRIPNQTPSAVRGLAYAGTFWGVVGYAIGTTIGVLMYRLFGWILRIA